METKKELKQIKHELDETIGDEDKELLKLIAHHLETQLEAFKGLSNLLGDTKVLKDNKQALNEVLEGIQAIKLKIPEELKVYLENKLVKTEETNPIKEIKVNNFSEIKELLEKLQTKEVRVSNLKDLKPPLVKIPDKIDVKKPDWYKQLTKESLLAVLLTFAREVNNLNGIKVDLDTYRDANRPLSVRLSDGKKFYNAIMQAISSSGGAFPFKTPSGRSKEALVDEDGTLNVRLAAGDIEMGAVEIKDGTTDARGKVKSDGTDNALVVLKNSPIGINGAPVTIGTTAVELTFTGTTKSICVKAASTNTGLIWIGPSTVDDTGANAYGELTADSSLTIDFNDVTTALYAVSNIAAQKIYKVALT